MYIFCRFLKTVLEFKVVDAMLSLNFVFHGINISWMQHSAGDLVQTYHAVRDGTINSVEAWLHLREKECVSRGERNRATLCGASAEKGADCRRSMNTRTTANSRQRNTLDYIRR